VIPLRKLTEGVRVEMRIQGKRGDTCLGFVLDFKGNQRKSVTPFSFAEIGVQSRLQFGHVGRPAIAYYLRHKTEVEQYLADYDRQAEEIRRKIEERQGSQLGVRARLLSRLSLIFPPTPPTS
jgi:hypothetical protein